MRKLVLACGAIAIAAACNAKPAETKADAAKPAAPAAEPAKAAESDNAASANPFGDEEPHRDGAAFPTETTFTRDSRTFRIAPLDGVEFNYQMVKGGSMVYSWKATGDVVWDFHGEPKGSKPGFAESYEMGEGTSGNGGFIAPSDGIHGWFWENQSDKPITVTLTTAGHYTGGVQIMGDGTRIQKQVTGR